MRLGESFIDFRIKDGKYIAVDKVRGKELSEKSLPAWARQELEKRNRSRQMPVKITRHIIRGGSSNERKRTNETKTND